MLSKQQILPDISHITFGEHHSFVLLFDFPYGKYAFTDIKKYGILKDLQPRIHFIDSETETILTIDYNGFSLLRILALDEGDL